MEGRIHMAVDDNRTRCGLTIRAEGGDGRLYCLPERATTHWGVTCGNCKKAYNKMLQTRSVLQQIAAEKDS